METPSVQASPAKERAFRIGCLAVGAIHVFFGSMILLRGATASLEEFEIPQEILSSAHFIDAIYWVYVHQLAVGLMIALVGWFAESPTLKRHFSRLMLLVNGTYAFMDLRSSDSLVGNSLYKGPTSLAPAIIASICTLIFLYLTFATRRRATD